MQTQLWSRFRDKAESSCALLSRTEAHGCYVCSVIVRFLKLAPAQKNREEKLTTLIKI